MLTIPVARNGPCLHVELEGADCCQRGNQNKQLSDADCYRVKGKNQASYLDAVASVLRSNAAERVYFLPTASKERDFEPANAPPAHKAKTQEIYSRRVYSKAAKQRVQVQH